MKHPPILVTGGAKGLGKEVALTLAKGGHSVAIHYNQSQKEAQAVVRACQKFGVEAQAVQGDFSTKSSLKKFVKDYQTQFTHTKGIVNNVGNYWIGPATQTPQEELESLYQVNFFSPVFLIQSLLPAIEKQQGSIVNVGTAGLLADRAFTKAPAYASTKSALWFYTRSLAKELAPKKVRVNMVSPGFMENAIDLGETYLPLDRAATLNEVAALIALFFEPATAYITGQNIEISGGVNL